MRAHSAIFRSTTLSNGRFYTYLVPQVLQLQLDSLALVAKEAGFLGSLSTLQLDTVLGRIPHPGLCTHSGVKHTPNLSEKVAYLLVQEICLEGYFLV